MNYYHIPSGNNGTRAEIDAAHAHNVIPNNVGAFINGKDWESQGGQTQPPVDGPFKPWRDNAALWSPQESYDYLVLARNADGSYAKWSLVAGAPNNSGPDNVPATGGLTEGQMVQMQAFSQPAWLFMHQYAADFGGVMPLVKRITVNRAEAERFSPAGAGTIADFPITVPSDVMFCFDLDGEPEWFLFADYVREHPTPVVKPATNGGLLTTTELLNAVTAIMANGSMKPEEKAEAIRRVAK